MTYHLVVLGIVWLAVLLVVAVLANKNVLIYKYGGGKLQRSILLAAYVLPMGLAATWITLGWPTSKLYLVVHPANLLVASLIAIGARATILPEARTSGAMQAYFATCCVVGLVFVTAAAPCTVYLEGQAAMAQIPAVRPASFSVVNEPPASIVVVALSDLHLTGALDRCTIEGDPSGESRIQPYIDVVSKATPPLIVVTGDITDGGETAQWANAYKLLEPLAHASAIVLAPGNHDLSAAYSSDITTRFGARCLAYLQLQAALNRDVCVADGKRGLAEVIADLQPTSEQIANARLQAISAAIWNARMEGARGNYFELYSKQITAESVEPQLIAENAASCWDSLFPLIWKAPSLGLYVLVLNSSQPADDRLGSSAIGSFGRGQYVALQLLLKEAIDDPSARAILILSHHPVARPPERWTSWQAIFDFGLLHLNPDNAVDVLESLEEFANPRGVRKLFLYGHRHERSFGTYGDLTMLELPTLYSKNDTLHAPERGMWTLYEGDGFLDTAWLTVLGE